MPSTLPASAIGQRYRPHIAELRGYINQVACLYRLLAPIMHLLFGRLHRSIDRLDRLATRWQQGHLRPTRPRRPTETRPAEPRPADARPCERTPSGHAWLIRLHQPMAQWAPRIQMMLDDPEIIALCAAAPQAGRLLRPLARMFGLTPPPGIARPPAPRRPRPRRPKPPAPPPFAEHSPSQWPFVPQRLRLRVPGLRRRKPPH